MNRKDVNDLEVISCAKQGDNDCLDLIFNEFRGYIRSLSNKYFLAGADKDDLIQEGMIGLFKAIRDYNPGEGVTFRTFAAVCIQRQIKTALKLATRQKHIPLNSSLSLQSSKFEDDDKAMIDFFEDLDIVNPEEIYINNETYLQMHKLLLGSLSKLEIQILKLYNKNLSYREIGQKTGKSVKSVDNTIQRIKKKIEKIKQSDMSL